MKSPNLDLSLVMPVYNEAHLIGESVRCLVAFAQELELSFELIVVNDGSNDGSGLALAGLQRKEPRLQVIELLVNEGKGSALQRGVLAAQGKVVATLDVDLSTNLEALPRALQAIAKGASMVIGNRRDPASEVQTRQPWLRALFGTLFNSMARLLVWPAIGDFTCGFKVYRLAAARELFESLNIARWVFDVELLAIARQRAIRVESIPVIWHHHSDTRVRLPGDALRALLDLLAVFGRRVGGAYRA